MNSKASFERFKLTGLSNFDFLRYDFINEDPETVFAEEVDFEDSKLSDSSKKKPRTSALKKRG